MYDWRRMTECEEELLKARSEHSLTTHAWRVLPNHCHVLVTTEQIAELRRLLGQFHGRSSQDWNGEDSARGRKVWYNCFERPHEIDKTFLGNAQTMSTTIQFIMAMFRRGKTGHSRVQRSS